MNNPEQTEISNTQAPNVEIQPETTTGTQARETSRFNLLNRALRAVGLGGRTTQSPPERPSATTPDTATLSSANLTNEAIDSVVTQGEERLDKLRTAAEDKTKDITELQSHPDNPQSLAKQDRAVLSDAKKTNPESLTIPIPSAEEDRATLAAAAESKPPGV